LASNFRVFSESFKEAVITTTVPNRDSEAGSSYSISDNVFIPSTTELRELAQGLITVNNMTYLIGTVYWYFKWANDEKKDASRNAFYRNKEFDQLHIIKNDHSNEFLD
jgi:hypothetical protein